VTHISKTKGAGIITEQHENLSTEQKQDVAIALLKELKGLLTIGNTTTDKLYKTDFATEAKQDSEITVLGTINTAVNGINTRGQGTMAESIPVVVANNQSAVQVSASKSVLATSNEEFIISSTGLISEKAAKNIYVLGRRVAFNATTPFQDIATYLVGGQNALNKVSVGTEYFIVSTSATDVAGSAGISKVRIVSLNAAGNQQVTSATLNGTTKVSIGTGYTAFQWMESSELGTAAATSAVGNISIFSGAGAAAAEATTVEQIIATGNRSMTARYTIPTGYTGYLKRFSGGAFGNQSMDLRIRADCFADDRTLSAGIFHFQAIAGLTAGVQNGSTLESEEQYQKFPAGCMIKASVYPSAISGTPRVDVTIHLILIAN